MIATVFNHCGNYALEYNKVRGRAGRRPAPDSSSRQYRLSLHLISLLIMLVSIFPREHRMSIEKQEKCPIFMVSVSY